MGRSTVISSIWSHLSEWWGRFYLWFYRKLVIRPSKIQMFIAAIAATRLRAHYDLPLVGENDSLDSRLGEAIDGFFGWNNEAQGSSIASDNFSQWLLKDPMSNDDRESYYRVSHWLSTEEDEAAKIASEYRALYDKDLEPIDDVDVWKAYDELKRRFKSEFSALRKSKAQRIKLNLKNLTPLLPWVSATLVIGAYVHTLIVYRHFGINPSQFFSISDYLASSIEQIQHALVGLLPFALGVLIGFRNETTKTKYEHERKARFSELYFIYLVPLFSLLFVILAFARPDIIFPYTKPYYAKFNLGVLFLAVVFIIWSPVAFFARHFFKNSYSVFLILMFLVMFFSSLFISAYQRIWEIEGKRTEMNFEIQIGTKRFVNKNAAFIGSNDRYIFLRLPGGDTKIIPLNKVDHFLFGTK